MCGIGGVVYNHPEQPVERDLLARMMDSIRHRGPDSVGFHIAPGIGFGIQRLSIIDLQTGDQPLFNEDRTVAVVCNGEIYNFQELRQELVAKGHCFRTQSDCEVIVHLYEEFGTECVHRLRYLDTMSMAYSLEVRVPFLDHEFVELCAQIPPQVKMHRLEEKHVLRRAMVEVLPPEIVHRKKRGLTAPFHSWLRRLPEFASELLSERKVRDKGYFDSQRVCHMLQQHQAGHADYGWVLMAVLKVQLWDDVFLRNSQPGRHEEKTL
jgi:asparagine synthetase B (glutamine-hydrolysing)